MNVQQNVKECVIRYYVTYNMILKNNSIFSDYIIILRENEEKKMKKKTQKLLSVLLVTVLITGLLAGCGKSATSKKTGTSEELTPMTIAFCTWAGYAPLYIAIEKGYFKELGYDAKVVIMEDESTYGAALVSNSVQALGQVLDRDIIQYDAGAPEQYVCTMDASTGGDGLIATADIKSMDDLAGKTVALDKSATSYFFFLQALADSNITEDQINIVEMGNDEAGEAFLSGNVDAAVTWEPALTNCTQREGGHILISSKDYPKAIIDVLTVNSNFLKDYPDAADALNDCWNKSVEYLKSNPEDAYQIMADGLGLTADDVKSECAGITFYDQDKNKSFNDLTTDQNVEDIAQMAADFWIEKGYMKKNDVSGFFNYLK